MIFVYWIVATIVLYVCIRGAVLIYDVFKYITDDDDDRYGGYWR